MNTIQVHFYKDNVIVRSEIFTNIFEADLFIEQEMKLGLYDKSATVPGAVDVIIR